MARNYSKAEQDAAYGVAERMIAEALASGANSLGFDIAATRALTALPPSIGDLAKLRTLDLDNTQVVDLAPLSGLTGLGTLFLDNTQVVDLAPLSGLTGLGKLWLDNTQVADLGPLSGLTGLGKLWLDNTQVADLGPLSGLTGMSELWVNNTQVADLAPLSGLGNLVPEQGKLGGLWIQETPAVAQDAELAVFVAIEDNRERTGKILAYVKEQAAKENEAPDQKGMPRVVIDGGRINVLAATPDAAEILDPVKQKTLARLQDAVERLVRAGNRYPDLDDPARGIKDLLAVPFAEMDLLEVHFELEILRAIFERRVERTGEDVLEPDVIAALSRVNQFGPPLTLDNDEVMVFERRQAEYAGLKANEKLLETLDALSRSITEDRELFGDKIREYSAVLQQGSSVMMDRLRVGQQDMAHNTVLRAGSMVVGGFVAGAAGYFGVEAMKWLVANTPIIKELAIGWGGAFDAWVTPILMQAKEALEIYNRSRDGKEL